MNKKYSNIDKLMEELLLESDNISKYQIAIDMDGVICDWTGAAEKYLNKIFHDVADSREELSQLVPDRKNPKYILYKLSRKIAEQLGGWDKSIKPEHFRVGAVKNFTYRMLELSEDFWTNMDWAPGGRRLWNFIAPYNPYILSSPIGDLSKSGKIKWCKKHLGLGPERIIIRKNKNVKIPNKIGILIDDTPKKLLQFPDIGILHVTGDAESTIKKLKEYGFE